MKNFFSTALFILLFNVCPAQPAVRLVAYAGGFAGAISDIAHTTDERLFIAEQMGYIRIIHPNGNVSSRPFLDIHSKVTPNQIDSVKEQGLLGVAFSPNFSTDGYFYVHYTNKTGVGNVVIARYHVSADPDSADAASEQILLTIYKPFTNHNGGCMKFGPDGYLYIGIGDGGGGGDQLNRAQNLDSLQGKILRIDISGGAGYSVPSSNPFVNAGGRDEIWAYGLRNPWRFSFDRLTHDLWIGDVGEQVWEEIDFQQAASAGGENYGWRCYEGNQVYNSSGCAASGFIAPVYSYSHTSVSACSVTGGYVYRGSAYPSLYGYYFYADFCNGTVYSLSSDGNFTQAQAGVFNGKFFSTFGENNAGELFVGDHTSGIVYRITDDPSSIEKSVNDFFQTRIYPLPSKGDFVCEFTLPEGDEVEVSITDIAGKEIYRVIKTGAMGRNSIEIHLKDFSTGLYQLRLKQREHSVSRKLTLHRE